MSTGRKDDKPQRSILQYLYHYNPGDHPMKETLIEPAIIKSTRK